MEPTGSGVIRHAPLPGLLSFGTPSRSACRTFSCTAPGFAQLNPRGSEFLPMDYAWYLFRFDGRINRARCWLALLIVICWMIFLSLVLFGGAHLFGATMPEQFDVGPNRIFDFIDPAAWRSLMANYTALFVQM